MAKSLLALPAFFFALLCMTASVSAAQPLSQFDLASSPSPTPTPPPLPPLPLEEDANKFQVSLEIKWDGMVTAHEPKTKEVLWSFSSGNPLSSAHGPVLDALEGTNSSIGIRGETPISEDEFIFCSTDWKLYSFDKKHGIEDLPIPPHELVQNTPTVLDGALILGSMTTSVFVLDAKTGSLVHTFDSRNESFPADHFGEEDIWRFLEEILKEQGNADYLFVLRKDYTIKSVAMPKGALLWNVSVADVRLHHINSDGTLRLPGSGEKRFRENILPQAVLSPVALPPGQQRHVELNRDEERHFVSWLLRGISFNVVAVTALVALFCAYLLGIWIRCRRKQAVAVAAAAAAAAATRRRRPRRARAGAVVTPQEPAHAHISSVSDNSVNLESSSTSGLLVHTSEATSEETTLGRLRVLSKQIGYGSNGTIVFEGYLEQRPVAIKRMLTQYYDKAQKEINNLIKSDEHPNILRYYHVESDAHFVYVALERCQFSLNDLVLAQSAKRLGDNQILSRPGELTKEELQSVLEKAGGDEDLELWDSWNRPSDKLLQLMRDILAGIAHLHTVGIVHRDLKPHNVLIANGRLQAKLSDMGISKQLADGVTTLDSYSTGAGSSGWQAPEQLKRDAPQTRSMDLFSLGCILFFSLSGGYHPFGTRFERDHNILNAKFDLFHVDHVPEAVDLIAALLQHDPSDRPHVGKVFLHPLFWSSKKRCDFLWEVSNFLEPPKDSLGSTKNDNLIEELEDASESAFGIAWGDKLDAAFFLSNVQKFRKYNFNSVRDLLRIFRNKYSHFGDFPSDFQQSIGFKAGYEVYFRSKFPRLLLEVFHIVFKHCENENVFRRFFHGE